MTPTSRPAYWWESPRQLGRNGDIVSPAGRSGAIPCPECGERPIVYNGNYFCDGYSLKDPECTWALSHPARTKKDREFCDLVGIDYD